MQTDDSLKKSLMLGKIEGRGEERVRGWDDWMASPIQWTWTWAISGRWWETGRPDMLQSMGSQRGGHNWVTEQKQYIFYTSLCVWVKLLQSWRTLYNPIVYSSPGSSVHGILQARILERIAFHSSRGSSQPRGQTWVSCMAGKFFTIWPTGEALPYI